MHIRLFEQWGQDDEDFDDYLDADMDDDLALDQTSLGDHSSAGLPFYCDCVGWQRGQMDLLHHLIDTGTEITRDEFLKHVSSTDMLHLNKYLGYNKGPLTMEKDWHVHYYTATSFDDEPIYYFVHSAIEYVFMEKPTTVTAPDDEDETDWE